MSIAESDDEAEAGTDETSKPRTVVVDLSAMESEAESNTNDNSGDDDDEGGSGTPIEEDSTEYDDDDDTTITGGPPTAPSLVLKPVDTDCFCDVHSDQGRLCTMGDLITHLCSNTLTCLNALHKECCIQLSLTTITTTRRNSSAQQCAK